MARLFYGHQNFHEVLKILGFAASTKYRSAQMVRSDTDGAFRGALTVLLPERLANWGMEP
ncbi:hypothetical protein MACH17_29440 [Phaeobacter inhibens]|nr:hypothetical protein MACH17_29440 [Phaeobacter inhibens]